jgi:hypothetical protein
MFSGSWVHTIQMHKYIQDGHMEAHVPDAGIPLIWMCGDPTIRVMGDPRSDDQLPPFSGETDPHPHYKHP